MKYEVGRDGIAWEGSNDTMEIEWKQIEGCITSDDAEIGILYELVRAVICERECHNTL